MGEKGIDVQDQARWAKGPANLQIWEKDLALVDLKIQRCQKNRPYRWSQSIWNRRPSLDDEDLFHVCS